MTTRALKKQQTRQAILDAALRLSADQGVASVSLRSLTREAGIAPTSFYRHFRDLEDLRLALSDQVGASLRLLVRRARERVLEDRSIGPVRACIEAFMQLAVDNRHLFRLLLGEGAGSTPAFRAAIHREIERFTEDLVADLRQAAELSGRPVAHIDQAAEAMVTVAFNLGARAIDLSDEERGEVTERIILEVRLIMRGAEAIAAGWEPTKPQ